MQQRYDEKLVENFIRDFPCEFLGEKLTFHRQQPSIGGFRPDLIFLDSNGLLVIVEVQLNALDRNHLYRMLEYRDLLIEQDGCAEPRLVLFCNEVPTRYKKILETHRILCVAISKNQFLEMAGRINPSLQIVEVSKEPESHALTVAAVLKELGKPAEEVRGDPDAIVFWFPGWFPFCGERNRQPSYDWLPLPKVPESTQLYFNDFNSYSGINGLEQAGYLEEHQIPREILIGRTSLEELSIEDFSVFNDWTDLLTHYIVLNHETLEVVLGYRDGRDIYGYEAHIRNRIRKFEVLWRRYGLEVGYDLDKFRSDMECLQGLKFYAGKYPELYSETVCEEIEIVDGPGSLSLNLHRHRSMIVDMMARSPERYGDEFLQKFETFVRQDQGEWVAVRFHNVNPAILDIIKAMSRMIKNAAWDVKKIDCAEIIKKLGLAPPKRLSDLPIGGIDLSRRYFSHLKPTMRKAGLSLLFNGDGEP